MRTVFVNPAPKKRRKRRKSSGTKKRKKTMAKRRRRTASYRRKPTRRRRRRNAGVTSFVQPKRNPLILSNPRRRRRRNPSKLNLKNIFSKTLTYAGGGAGAYAVNQFALRRVQNDWLRRGLQVATAVGGGILMKGELGASFAGGMMYPLMADLALMMGVTAAQDYDTSELAADLEAALDEGGYLEADLEGGEPLYVSDDMDEYDLEPEEEELYVW